MSSLCNSREDLSLICPTTRTTKRLANHILELCKFMTVKEIEKHPGLDRKAEGYRILMLFYEK